MAPGECCLRAGLDSDDGAGLGGWVGAAVADDVVGRHVSDWLRDISKIIRVGLESEMVDIHHRMKARGHRRQPSLHSRKQR